MGAEHHLSRTHGTLLYHRYENIVQIRCLFEGIAVEEMLLGWEKMLPEKMEAWKLDRSEV